MHGLIRSLAAALLACAVLASCASARTQVDRGLWHYNSGLWGQALPLLLEGVPALDAASPTDPRVPQGYATLANLALQDKKPDLAASFFDKALANARTHQSKAPHVRRSTFNVVGMHLMDRGRPAEALPLFVEAAQISEHTPSMSRRLFAIDLDNLALAQMALGDEAAATLSGARALAALNLLEQTPAVRGTRGVVIYNTAYRLAAQGKDAEAETLFRESIPLIAAASETWRLKVVAREYAKLLTKLGRTSEAEALLQRYP